MRVTDDLRLSDPFWFQALGSVMGMDWHSSGISPQLGGRTMFDAKPGRRSPVENRPRKGQLDLFSK